MKIEKMAYASAKVFTDIVENYALMQIAILCDKKAFMDQEIRFVQDVHIGKIGTIGFASIV